jgi:hypothetical protein
LVKLTPDSFFEYRLPPFFAEGGGGLVTKHRITGHHIFLNFTPLSYHKLCIIENTNYKPADNDNPFKILFDNCNATLIHFRNCAATLFHRNFYSNFRVLKTCVEFLKLNVCLVWSNPQATHKQWYLIYILTGKKCDKVLSNVNLFYYMFFSISEPCVVC